MSLPGLPPESPSWSLTTRWVVAILVLISIVWLLAVALPLVEAIFIAALIAYLLDPIVRYLMRRTRMRRTLATILVYLIVLLIVLSLPTALGALAFGQFRNFSINLNEAIRELQNWLSQPVYFFGFRFAPQSLFNEVGQALGGVLTVIPGGSFDIVSGLTTNILWGLVIFFSLYYFLKDGPKIKPWVVSLFPAAYQADAEKLTNEIDDVWSVFLRVQLLIFLIIAVLTVLGSLLVVGMYQAGLIPFSWIGLVVMLIIVYALVQQVDNLWLRPRLLGERLRLHPALVVVGLIGALALSGLLGALIVVPMIATGKIVGHYIQRKLLGLPPWLPEDGSALPEQTSPEEDATQSEISLGDKTNPV